MTKGIIRNPARLSKEEVNKQGQAYLNANEPQWSQRGFVHLEPHKRKEQELALKQAFITNSQRNKKMKNPRQMLSVGNNKDQQWLNQSAQSSYYDEPSLSVPDPNWIDPNKVEIEEPESTENLTVAEEPEVDLEMTDIEEGKFCILVNGTIVASFDAIDKLQQMLEYILLDESAPVKASLEEISVFQRLKIKTGVWVDR